MIIPPLEGMMKLPSMLTLYRRDWVDLPLDSMHIRLHHCIDIPPKIACTMCRQFPKMWGHVMDFIQEGNIALLESHEQCTLDWSLISFRAYVAAKAKGHIIAYMTQTKAITIPRTPRRTMVKKGQQEEIDALEYHMSWELLLENIDIGREDISDFQYTYNSAAIKHVESLLTCLPQKEAECLSLYFGIGTNAHSTQEIADIFHMTSHNANFLVNLALKRTRGDVPVSRSKEFDDQERLQRLESIYSEKPHVKVSELKKLARCSYIHAKAFLKSKAEERSIDIHS